MAVIFGSVCVSDGYIMYASLAQTSNLIGTDTVEIVMRGYCGIHTKHGPKPYFTLILVHLNMLVVM